MSHFTVLVVTKEPPTQEVLHKTLLPWHEYECTGYEEYLEFVPEDMDHLNAMFKEYSDGRSFEDFMEDWSNAFQKDGVWGRWTNPNAKWDWWQLGGRWTGMLRQVPGSWAFTGDPGIMTNTCDACQIKNLDWESMLEEDIRSKRNSWYKFVETYQEQCNHHNIPSEQPTKALARYREICKELIALKSNTPLYRLLDDDVEGDMYRKTIGRASDYIADHVTNLEDWLKEAKPLETFAFVKDGEWRERGNMGWWAIVTDEKDNWTEEYKKMLDSLDSEDWVSVVDCHI